MATAQRQADEGRARRAAAAADGALAAETYAASRGSVAIQSALGPSDKDGYAELDWSQMVPPEDMKLLEDAPPVLHIGSRRSAQVGTLHTVGALEGRKVRLPGFVVPLESDGNGHMTEFFFVPFYGACIHVPPPPPNMLVHVRLAKPIDTPSLYDTFTLKGTLHTVVTQNAMASSAYAMDGATLETYRNDAAERLRNAFE
ncbi:DUF3299 domain-containing protein [Luteibacter rhizovicinus]|uniref:DUF3299 domain-containing protein n=1 Tax=Luteibacter rhizovicinus TaxID=242606 RepID=UPI001FB3578C|nr:DUF3299 domain-containing protein [Luteibacter rhizovicinus]